MSGAGIEQRCLDFSFNYTYSPTNNNYYVKMIKRPDDIMPQIYISDDIFTIDKNPAWNPRQLFTFNFDMSKQTRIKAVMAQYEPNPKNPISEMICFNVFMVKPREGDGNKYHAIKAGKEPHFPMEWTINENSFFPVEAGIIRYFEYPSQLVYEFYCGWTDLTDIYSLDENDNDIQRLVDLVYLTQYNLTTGWVDKDLEQFQVKCLIRPTHEVVCTVIAQTPWISMSNNPFLIPKDDMNYHIVSMNTIGYTMGGEVPLIFTSLDPIFHTFDERIKVVAGIEFVIIAVQSGLIKANYTLLMKVIMIDIVDKHGSNNVTLNVGEETTLYVKINPPEALIDLKGTMMLINITNHSPLALVSPEFVWYPVYDSSGNAVGESRIIVESTGLRLTDSIRLSFRVSSNISFFNNFEIADTFIQVSSLELNKTRLLVNIQDQYNPIYSDIVRLAPSRVGDIQETMDVIGTISPSAIATRTFYYDVTWDEEELEFVIKEKVSGAVDLKTFNYNSTKILEGFALDRLHFDVSDITNLGQKLTFYEGNEESSLELTDEDGLPLAEYSRNLPSGRENGYVSILIPEGREFIYYRTAPFNSLRNWALEGFGSIKCLPVVFNEIGTFDIAPINPDGTGGEFSLTSNGLEGQIDITLSIPNNDLFGKASIPVVSANMIKVQRPVNLRFRVYNETNVRLSWDIDFEGNDVYSFADPLKTRYMAKVEYEIYKFNITKDTGSVSGDDISLYDYHGLSANASYVDNTVEIFNTANYRVRSLITWEGVTVVSEFSDSIFVFVCESNQFPNGRYNNSRTNKKLYQSLNDSCDGVNMQVPQIRSTGNLYPNSQHLTRKETFALLAGKMAPKR